MYKELFDRLIFNRRPQNSTERRLHWARLPQGCLFGKLRLGNHEGLRGSGDDLKSYFYQLRNHPSQWHRNAFGRRIRGEDFTDFGGSPGVNYRLCLIALGMGGHNSVDIAQEVHEQLLRNVGLIVEEKVIRFGKPVPQTSIIEGVYIDDHIVVARLPLALLDEPWGPIKMRMIGVTLLIALLGWRDLKIRLLVSRISSAVGLSA